MNAPSKKSIKDRYGTHSLYVVEHRIRGRWHLWSDYTRDDGITRYAWASWRDAVNAKRRIYHDHLKRFGNREIRRADYRVRLYARVEG